MTESKADDTITTQSESNSASDEVPAPTTEEVTLDQARRFLQDDHVRSASLERKAGFLRSKGLSDAQIAELLGQEAPPQVS